MKHPAQLLMANRRSDRKSKKTNTGSEVRGKTLVKWVVEGCLWQVLNKEYIQRAYHHVQGMLPILDKSQSASNLTMIQVENEPSPPETTCSIEI
jgi:hypothetical protein